MIIPDKKKKLKNGNTDTMSLKVLGTIGVLLLLLFALFHPKVSSQLFSQKRSMILSSFLENVQNNQGVDPRRYWEFREFYSPGYFDISLDGISSDKLSLTKDKLGVLYNEEKIDRVFLVFKSPLVLSYDILTKEKSLKDIVLIDELQEKEVIYQDENTFIIKMEDHTIKIIFLKSLEEMKKANGFFDYRDLDKEKVKDKNWVNVTTISQ